LPHPILSDLSSLRIAYVLDGLETGGAQRQAVELAVSLRRGLGQEIRVVVYRDPVTISGNNFGARLADAGVPVERVAKRVRLDPTWPFRFSRLLARHRINVVHAFMPIPAAWALLGSLALPADQQPVVVSAERSALASAGRLGNALRWLVYRASDAVTVNSFPAGVELQEQLGIRSDRICYLPNGIDLDEWDRTEKSSAPWDIEPGFFHIGLLGRFSPEKNHALLIDALTRVEAATRANWRVWFVGAGAVPAERARLEEAIKRRELGSIVRVMPPTQHVAALLRRLDLLVLPSSFEGFPNVVLEAMASRTLVAATPVGDVPNLIQHRETGLLFARHDASALASTIREASALALEERRRIVTNARRLVEARFRIDVVAADHLALYRSLRAAARRGQIGSVTAS
jgi:glycosyltransferase involved in cell wall biosynthesis